MRHAVNRYHFACISADYRLAPQATVKDIYDDVKHCIDFIRNGELSKHVPQRTLDVTRLAVSGSSAGGYLTLLAGLYIEPKPQIIMPIYPITDPLGRFFTTPQPAPNGRYAASEQELSQYLDKTKAASANCGKLPDDTRMHMYVYMLRNANLAKLWGVPDESAAAPFRIAQNIVKHRLPPTYMLHGDADKAVGVEQADEVVGVMVGAGIDVIYERPVGKDHFLDMEDGYKNEAMYDFMMKHI